MNTSKIRPLFWCLMVGFLGVVTCREITTITTVRPDGSLERIIKVTGDSSDVFDEELPLPRSAAWEVTEQGPSEDNGDFIYAIRGQFADTETLNGEFESLNQQGDVPARRVELHKRFRWFYTFLTYREIYPQWNALTAVPLQEYFTDEERRNIHLFLTESDSFEMSLKDSTALAGKFFQWIGRNFYEELFQLLEEAAGKSTIPDLTPEMIRLQKDPVWEAYRDSIDENVSFEDIMEAAEHMIDPISIDQLIEANPWIAARLDSLQTQFSESLLGDAFGPEYGYNDQNVVEMPGLILDTNGEQIEGNRVTWDTGNEQYFVYDYVMWVESRMVNRWAIWVSGGLLVLILAGIVVSFVRQRVIHRKEPVE